MTPEKKKLLLYAGGATALTLLVYFVFFSKKFNDKLKKAPVNPIKPNPKPNPNQIIDYPEYPTGTLPTTVSTKSGTRLRKDPNTNSTILKTYNSGVTLHPDDSMDMEDGTWYHVTEGGWVRSDVVNEFE